MIADWDLTRTNLRRLREHKFEVAVLPTAAHEAHNLHLPEGQDFLHTSHVARVCTERAYQETQSVVCLPGLPFGVDANLLDFPLSIHVAQATLDAMIRDIALSLRHHGIRKLVIINGHGGNDFAPLVRQFQADTDMHLFTCDWWKVGADKYSEFFEKPDDHAGELETSVAMALFPELVDQEVKPGDGSQPPFRFEALQEGWVKTSRNFGRLNDHCAVGDPSAATPEKGHAYLALATTRISRFLVELAQSPIDKNFPHVER